MLGFLVLGLEFCIAEIEKVCVVFEKQYTTKSVYLFNKTTSIEEGCPKLYFGFHGLGCRWRGGEDTSTILVVNKILKKTDALFLRAFSL
jgi:hypothetical protein